MEQCPQESMGTRKECQVSRLCTGQYASTNSSSSAPDVLGYYAGGAALEKCDMCESGKYADEEGLSTYWLPRTVRHQRCQSAQT